MELKNEMMNGRIFEFMIKVVDGAGVYYYNRSVKRAMYKLRDLAQIWRIQWVIYIVSDKNTQLEENKVKKLLFSVTVAVLLIAGMSVAASAAATSYDWYEGRINRNLNASFFEHDDTGENNLEMCFIAKTEFAGAQASTNSSGGKR